ncbi:MAG: hypothetical protein OHK0038_14450 [Flammeovirgaceae bacterium]
MRFFEKTQKIHRRSVGFAQSQKIGVIAYIEQIPHISILTNFIQQLSKEGKSVETILFVNTPLQSPNIEGISVFSYRDLTLLGKWKNDKLFSFIQQPFDYLFCLNSPLIPPIINLLNMSKAHCRVGVHDEKHEKCFELMIRAKEGEKIEVITEQMLKYTKSIMSKAPVHP